MSYFLKNHHSASYIYFLLQFFSSSSSLRRNFRLLAPPENKSPTSFQSVLSFFLQITAIALGVGGCNCRSKQGDIFQSDIQSETPFSPEEKSIPRLI